MIQVPIAKEKYDELASALKQKYGIEIAAPTGTIMKSGVTASYSYDGTNLSVTVTHAPFPFSKDYCERQVQGWIEEEIA